MDIKPRAVYGTAWDKVRVNAKFQVLLDSEFCPDDLDEAEELDKRKKNMTLDLR
jgi:hypothetical protein